MSTSDLLDELRTALYAADAAEGIFREKEHEAREARAEWRKTLCTVEEIEEEILTGKSDRPIIDRVGTTHTSAPINGSKLPTVEETKAKLAQDALDDLLHESGNEDNLEGKHRKRKAVRFDGNEVPKIAGAGDQAPDIKPRRRDRDSLCR